jgi:hypothetical protein
VIRTCQMRVRIIAKNGQLTMCLPIDNERLRIASHKDTSFCVLMNVICVELFGARRRVGWTDVVRACVT